MKNVKLASRYARALYEFSLEKDQLEEVYKDVLLIMGLLKVNKELNLAVECPIVPHATKVKIFKEVFSNAVTSVAFDFLKLVVSKKREPELLYISEEFVKLYYRFHNIKVINFVTAQQVDDSVVEKLKEIMQKRTGAIIEVKSVVMPQIIGGFIMRMEDFVYDASILRQISMLKREFSYNIYQAGF